MDSLSKSQGLRNPQPVGSGDGGKPPRQAGTALADPDDGQQPRTGKPFVADEPDDQPLVRVTVYKQQHLKKKTMTWEQSQRLPTEDVDLYVNMVDFRVIVRRPDGFELDHKRSITGIGMVVFAIVLKLLKRRGFFMNSYQIGKMRPYYDSHIDCLESYICRNRKHVFAESQKKQHFILSLPGPTYAFNGDLSFRLIERIDPAQEAR